MARPDQDTIRRILIETELGHMPPSIRHRVYRAQTSDRAEARAEAQSLLRPRQRDAESNRDTLSRGERRAAPSEDPTDAQRRQRPRFSADSFNSLTAPALTQNPTSAQRTPAWQQGPALTNLWAMNPQYGSAGSAPAGHLPNFGLPPFPMTSTSFSHDSNDSNFPPMLSREDFYAGPQHSELGFDVSRAGAAHEYTLPRPLHSFARHTHSPGDPFHYATHQHNNQNSTSYSNMAQPVEQDGPSQNGLNSALPNRN